MGKEAKETSQNEVFSIIVDVLLVANVFIFAAKSVVELSIGVNRITNIVEGINLTFLLFATFMGFTLKGLTVIQNYKWFEPEYLQKFYSFQSGAQQRQFEILFLGSAAFFYPFRAF